MVTSNNMGIVVGDSNSVNITGNDVKNNSYAGMVINHSSAEIHFNRIAGNAYYGLYSLGDAMINVTNNWWGINNPVNSTTAPSDICVYSGSVVYDPWLVLTVNTTSYKVSDGKIYEATITTDLNHNSNGEYLSTVVYVPDGILVNFTTDKGNLTSSTGYTQNGQASSVLVLDPSLQSGFTNVTAGVDGQNATTLVNRLAKVVITVASTAIDLSTGEMLYLNYELPLNESVVWVSVLYKSVSADFGVFQNEVDLIVNGEVVLSRIVSNEYYLYFKDLYSEKVWYNINFLNWLFSDSTDSKSALESMIDKNPGLQNLTGNSLKSGVLGLIQEINGFSDDEMYMIGSFEYFTDVVGTRIIYPGDASNRITVQDPDTNEIISLDFGGSPILRQGLMIYANGGYVHVYDTNPISTLYKSGGYEGVRSFAIVTTKVTDDILRYWLDQKDKTDANGTLVYQNGAMKAAYGTFLEALLMIKCHDMVADQAANQYNVTWTRTTPIVVSVYDDAYRTVMTLECDHRFGMDVTGDANNVTAFRYACSSAISPLESYVMKELFPGGGNGTSVTIGIGGELFNGLMPSIFMSNGYLVIRSSVENMFLVFDPVTGILRDVYRNNSTVYGSYCFSDQQTELGINLLDRLLNNPMSIPWMSSVPLLSMGANPFALMFGFSGSGIGLSETVLTDFFVSLGIGEPVAAGLSGLTRFARNPLSAALIGTFIAVFVGGNYLCDQYGWLPPRNFNEDCETVKEFLIMSLAGDWWDYGRITKKEKKRDKQKAEEEIDKKRLHLDNLNSDNGPDSSKLRKAIILTITGIVVAYKVAEPLYKWLIDLLSSNNNTSNNTTNGNITYL